MGYTRLVGELERVGRRVSSKRSAGYESWDKRRDLECGFGLEVRCGDLIRGFDRGKQGAVRRPQSVCRSALGKARLVGALT